MKLYTYIVLLYLPVDFCNAEGGLYNLTNRPNESVEFSIIGDIVINNLKYNGWNNILFMGNMDDYIYNKLKSLQMTYTTADVETKMYEPKQIVPYKFNTVIINCKNLKDFQKSIRKLKLIAYWHPHANIILYFNDTYDKDVTAKLFYILWYYNAINAIIIHNYNSRNILISYYSPFDQFYLDNLFGCWLVGLPIKDFEKNFQCIEKCHNVTVKSILRVKHLGTCIAFSTHMVSEKNKIMLQNLFRDKSKNMHRYTLRAIALEVSPFLKIDQRPNKTYSISGRDGLIWKTLGNLMNFTIDLSSNEYTLNKKFNYKVIIQQLYSFSQRKYDLILFPIYQFDLLISPMDITFPFMESGVCFISKKSDFEIILLNSNFLQNNYLIIIEFHCCFVCIWIIFFIFNAEKIRKFSFDQVGKDLMNASRVILSIGIINGPRRKSFRVFLITAIWGFFIINFVSQAAVISIFSTYNRGRNIDTFNDVIDNIKHNNYVVEGMASPDVFLANTDKKLNFITSKLNHRLDMFECIRHLRNDNKRVCLIDCAIGRYLERSEVNVKGEQYLHVAKGDQVHSLYLNMLLPQYSVLTERYNKYIMLLIEAGIIKKWMEYRYVDTTANVSVRVISMKDLTGIFQTFVIINVFIVIIFLVEVCLGKLRLTSKARKINIFK